MRKPLDPRRHLLASVLLTCLTTAPCVAQTPDLRPRGGDALAGPTSHAPVVGADPVVGSIEGKLVYLSDVTRIINTLPAPMRGLPFDAVMPLVLDRIIDHAALTMTARRAGLDKQPEIQREMEAAADRVLEQAWLARVTPGKVTEAAIEARFDRDYANRPATDEVRARHILVGTEAEANAVLAELKNGADFATVARKVSKDPDASQGGDLGFFRRDQVWPGFADVAFSLRPGELALKPVHNEFGWHIVKVEERRVVAPPKLSDLRDKIRQELTAEAVHDAIADARSQLIIHKFNLDGSEMDDDPRLNRTEP